MNRAPAGQTRCLGHESLQPAVAIGHRDGRQCDDGAPHLLARRTHDRVAANHDLARLIGALARQHDAAAGFLAGAPDRHREDIANSDRLDELQRLSEIHGSGRAASCRARPRSALRPTFHAR